jgi:hyperosmotically inducible protein
MKIGMLVTRILAAAVVAGAGVAGAANRDKAVAPKTDGDLVSRLQHEIRMYPYYTIWDDLSFRVNDGHVELLGAVSQPYKKQDIERLVERVPGVAGVTDEIKVLPVSPMDDRLRLQIARAIYRDPSLSRYAIQAVPPIHIIVDNGHVTLTGVVNNDVEKQIAGMRASSAGLSFGPVTNDLEVEHPAVKKS